MNRLNDQIFFAKVFISHQLTGFEDQTRVQKRNTTQQNARKGNTTPVLVRYNCLIECLILETKKNLNAKQKRRHWEKRFVNSPLIYSYL